MRPKINESKVHDLLYDEQLKQFAERARRLEKVKTQGTVSLIFGASVFIVVMTVVMLCTR